jgi:uncharacterized membrane protein YedE/YeeE
VEAESRGPKWPNVSVGVIRRPVIQQPTEYNMERRLAGWMVARNSFREIASAIVVAAAAVAVIRRLGLKTVSGEPITIPPKSAGRGIRYAVGGTIFGLGWALTGACPGPLFALVGKGVTVMIAAIASALAGTWLYGVLRLRLPH